MHLETKNCGMIVLKCIGIISGNCFLTCKSHVTILLQQKETNKERIRMLKKYLLVSLLVCGGMIQAETLGKLERFGFNPKCGFKNVKNISAFYVSGNAHWTLKTDKIKRIVVNPAAIIDRNLKRINQMYLYVDTNKVNMEKVNTLTVRVTYLDKTTKEFRLCKSGLKGFFAISQRQVKQIFNSNVDFVAYGMIDGTQHVGCASGVRNQIVSETFFDNIIKKFGEIRI